MEDVTAEIIYGKRVETNDLIIKGYRGRRFGDDYYEKVLKPLTCRLEREAVYNDA